VRGGQAALINFLLLLFYYIYYYYYYCYCYHHHYHCYVAIYYFRLDTGFTILRNVHVLWVRAPLSKQVP